VSQKADRDPTCGTRGFLLGDGDQLGVERRKRRITSCRFEVRCLRCIAETHGGHFRRNGGLEDRRQMKDDGASGSGNGRGFDH